MSLRYCANNFHPLMRESEHDILFSFYDVCLPCDNFAHEQLLLFWESPSVECVAVDGFLHHSPQLQKSLL